VSLPALREAERPSLSLYRSFRGIWAVLLRRLGRIEDAVAACDAAIAAAGNAAERRFLERRRQGLRG